MEQHTALFGPAGNGDAFYAQGKKQTLEAPAWLAEQGLTAYEYQCGRGVRISEAAAAALKAEGKAHGVHLSVHAPYYISLASADPAKRENSLTYIRDSALAVSRMGGERIVVHPGGLCGLSRDQATALAAQTLAQAQQRLDAEGLSHVHICPETMGKINQLGDLDEVLHLCAVDERFLPCIDWGHMNARTGGALDSCEAFAAVLDTLADRLGEERARICHMHFSKIEYAAGGEKRHLTFTDTAYGPQPEPLMELLATRGFTPVVICESAGTQAEDAHYLQSLYFQYTKS